MSQPFYQPARQNFSSSQSMQQPQGGFGGFGGYQMPQQNWGGGQGFSGFGGGQGFNFGGGQAFGGFQQPQFNPFQGGFGGGFGGGFSPFQGGFGGFNPMFGGIGSLGFNPMMGQGFGMPMQGFNPYQQRPYNPDRANESGMPMPGPTGRETFDNPRMMDMMYRGGLQMPPEMRQRREQDMRNMERMANSQPQVPAPWMPTITETPGFGDWQQKQKQWADQTPEGISYTKANEALEAFKKANPNVSSYSGYWADPALKAQYDKIYGDYQSGTQTYFNKLNEYEKTNPFSPTAQQPQSPFTGPQRSAQDILSMAVGKTPQDMQYDINKDGKITSADALAYQRQYGQQPQTPQTPIDSGMNRGVDNMSIGPVFVSRQPMFGGIGGLGFNPMMGPQFGMPKPYDPFVSYSMPRASLQAEQTAEAGQRAYAQARPEERELMDRIKSMSMPERQSYYGMVDAQAQNQARAEAMRYLQSRG